MLFKKFMYQLLIVIVSLQAFRKKNQNCTFYIRTHFTISIYTEILYSVDRGEKNKKKTVTPLTN